MPYANAAAISRPEINAFLEEAQAADTNLIAGQVLGIYNSPSRAGRYPRLKITAGELLKAGDLQAGRRGPTGTYSELDRKWEWDTFDCEDRGYEERIDDALAKEMANFFDAEVTTAKLLRRYTMLGHEKAVADLVMSAANSGFDATNSSVAYTEANIATFDFPKDVQDALDRLAGRGVEPNAMIMSRQVYNRIRRSSFMQKYIYGNLPGAGNKDVTAAAIADAFGIPQVLIAGAKYDTAGKGVTASLSPIWGNTTVLLAQIGAGDFMAGGIGRTIVWTEDASGLYVTETYRDEKRRGDMVRVRMHNTNKIIDTTAGELITTQWA
jgi:hypothetical protein